MEAEAEDKIDFEEAEVKVLGAGTTLMSTMKMLAVVIRYLTVSVLLWIQWQM